MFVPSVAAKEPHTPKIVVMPKVEVVNKDYFAAGNSVTISGTVNGDAFIAGGTVVVDGTINGDLFAAGGNIDIRGKVTHSVRVAGGNIDITGTIGGNVVVGGGNVRIEDTARISGSLIAGGGMIDVLAPIGKGMTVGVGTLRVGNNVGGDVTTFVNQLFLESRANIVGNVSYWSKNKITLADGAVIHGSVTQFAPPVPKTSPVDVKKVGVAFVGAVLVFKLIEFFGVFLVGALLLSLAPKYAKEAIETMKTKPWASLGIGFVATILAPVAIVVLLVSMIGVPLAVILLAAIVVLFFVIKIYAALLVGVSLLSFLKVQTHIIVSLLVGWILIFALGFIPIIGSIVLSILMFVSLGGILLTKQKTYHLLRAKNLI